MFRKSVVLPDNAPVIPFYDVREIDGTTTELKFFLPNPSREDNDNNYRGNPLPGDNNFVLMAIKVDATIKNIKSTANIDPQKVVNQLTDAVIEIRSNRGREEALLTPLDEYMNLNGIQASNYHDGTNFEQSITLQASKPRRIDNLFAFGPNGAWDLSIHFKTGDFPAQADWSTGRFGLKTTLYMAELTSQQLARYEQRLEAVANPGGQ